MQDKELYQHMLGLNSPWSVQDVELDCYGPNCGRIFGRIVPVAI